MLPATILSILPSQWRPETHPNYPPPFYQSNHSHNQQPQQLVKRRWWRRLIKEYNLVQICESPGMGRWGGGGRLLTGDTQHHTYKEVLKAS